MDRTVVERKLEVLRHCLLRLRAKRPASAQLLAADADLQDVLVLNLSRAVQVCVDIGTHLLAGSDQPVPMTMGETFVCLSQAGMISAESANRLRQAVGFRNIAVHNYDVIDWDIVFALTGEPLQDFDRFAVEVSLHLR